MKVYLGIREPNGCRVDVRQESCAASYPLPLRLEIANHSPTGLEWGYGGSGPAQLALAILADHFGPLADPPACPYCGGSLKDWCCLADKENCGYDGARTSDMWKHIKDSAYVHYQDFKSDIVAKLPRPGFVLAASSIQEWADRKARKTT